MATSKSAHKHDDDDNKKLPNKRGKHLQPLHEQQLKKQLANDKEHAQNNADVLAELAAKTAALADKLPGAEAQKERILKLDDPASVEPRDIYAALDDVPGSPAPVPMPKPGSSNPNPAADLIREKLRKLYGTEPDASSEAAEAAAIIHRSKHQQYMYELTTSGKSLAEIQTQWHNYYVALPDEEKHQVWQEFYRNQTNISAYAKHQLKNEPKPEKEKKPAPAKRKPADFVASAVAGGSHNPPDIKSQLLEKLSAGGKLKPVHHVKSALFGLGLAGFVGLVITFLFFNEVFIAPFISPSRSVSATPIIGQVDGPIDPAPKIIIPKINLEVPVVYDLGTIDEGAVQSALEDGVVHYAASPEPGQQGNAVIVGHSSNNILNSGKYKFAFVLLKRLEIDDTFFVHKDGVRYTYKVYDKRIVPPTDVSVLGPAERANSITLITCDPPGTSINRLIIVAEQISPDPSSNTAAETDIAVPTDKALPSNAPSLWSRVWPF